MYTVEFQKCGLPHAHILIWLSKENKINNCDDIGKHISAELPDLVLYPKLYQAVETYMMHGPCGSGAMYSPCLENNRCSKFFPTRFVEATSINDDGYPIYKRRDFVNWITIIID